MSGVEGLYLFIQGSVKEEYPVVLISYGRGIKLHYGRVHYPGEITDMKDLAHLRHIGKEIYGEYKITGMIQKVFGQLLHSLGGRDVLFCHLRHIFVHRKPGIFKCHYYIRLAYAAVSVE